VLLLLYLYCGTSGYKRTHEYVGRLRTIPPMLSGYDIVSQNYT